MTTHTPSIALDPVLPPEPRPERPVVRSLRSRIENNGATTIVLATLSALIASAVLIAISDPSVRAAATYFFAAPGDTLGAAAQAIGNAYAALFTGAIFDPANAGSFAGSLGPIAGTLELAAPLICAALGFSIAFRAGLFNIGGQGQIIVGAFTAGFVGFSFSWLSGPVLIAVAAVAGMAAGAMFGFIAGWLKAVTGANEVITTIMLNYVAIYGLRYLLSLPGIIEGPGGQASRIVPAAGRLPGFVPGLSGLDIGILLAVLAAAATWWVLERSTLGFRIRAVGENPAAARTAGMHSGRTVMSAMALSGAAAGLAGVLLTLGGASSYQVSPNIESNIGFSAITVALLAKNSPKGAVLAGILMGALRQGGATMQAATSVPVDLVTVMQALIVIFVAAPELTRGIYRLKVTAADVSLGLSRAADRIRARSSRIPAWATAAAVIGAFGLLLACLSLTQDARLDGSARYSFSFPGSVDLGTWAPNARELLTLLGILALAAAIATVALRRVRRSVVTVAIVAIALGLVSWAIAGSAVGINVVSLTQGTVFPAAVPLVLAALAGVIGERSGVVQVSLEGQLLFGAFAAAIVGSLTHSAWAGLAAGILVGMLAAGFLGQLALRYQVDQVISGVVLNLLALGLTSFLFIQVMVPDVTLFNSPAFFPVIPIPGLSLIPIIGPTFFSGTILLYASYVLVAGVAFALRYTRWGLRLGAVGEHPRASDTAGISVRRTRMRALLIAGAIAGIGGAFLVLGTGASNAFQINMSAGKGFIALAAVIFGRWNPIGAALAALLFGFADQLQNLLALAGTPINSNLLLMMPYVITILAVAGFVGRVRPPAALGQEYR